MVKDLRRMTCSRQCWSVSKCRGKLHTIRHDFHIENNIRHFIMVAGQRDVLSSALVVAGGEGAGGAVIFDAGEMLGAKDAMVAAAIHARLIALELTTRRR